jgi:hypothetical protein
MHDALTRKRQLCSDNAYADNCVVSYLVRKSYGVAS